jgi:hypothetical protein
MEAKRMPARLRILHLEPESQDQGCLIIACGDCSGYLKGSIVEDWGTAPPRPHRASRPLPAAVPVPIGPACPI